MACNILVIDDEPTIGSAVENALNAEDHCIIRATNSNEALTAAREQEFNLTFFCIDQRSLGSFETLSNLRKQQPLCPVVILTAQPSVASAIEALRLGAFDYLVKPLSDEALLQTIRSALRSKRKAEAKERHRINLQGIISTVRDSIITIDQQARFDLFNPAALAHFGFTEADLGKKTEQIHLTCGNNCLALLAKVLDSGTPLERYRQQCLHPERTGLIVTARAEPLLSEQGQLRGAVLLLREETRLQKTADNSGEQTNYHNLVGQSPEMRYLYGLLDKLAQVSSTVLLNGESGTGKELVAEALHYKGNRRNRPFVRVNCAGLSETLLDSELFGHTKGSFTGAIKDRCGRFEMAQGGTIFLDEIGDISQNLQQKLLRVLQEKEIERVGDATPIPVDVRIIAATHQDLQEKIRRGQFREDLYFRLKVIHLRMPPLHQRLDDLPLLVEHFVDLYSQQFNKAVVGVSEKVQQIFTDYSWPGNVRELKHALEHAFIFNETGLIDVDDLPLELRESSFPFAPPPVSEASLADQPKEEELLRTALAMAGGNKAKAARQLNVSRQTLYRKLRQYRIETD